MLDWYHKFINEEKMKPDDIIHKTLAEYGFRSGDESVIKGVKNILITVGMKDILSQYEQTKMKV